MRIIEKIEIKNFRSFLWTRKWEEAIIDNITDLNIFSGSNDSWKSNVLRALNLFFNDKISVNDEFNFFRDFPYFKIKDYQKVIGIKIYFDLTWIEKRDKFLPEKFAITKFYNQFSNEYRDYLLEWFNKSWEQIKIFSNPEKNALKKSEKQYRQHLFGFLNNISFEYVPAIKDQRFFSNLLWRVILLIKNKEDNEILEIKNKIDYYKEHEKSIRKIENLIRKREKNIKKGANIKKEKIWEREILSFKEDIKNLENKDFREKEIKELNKKLEKISIINKAINSLKEWIDKYSWTFLDNVSSFLPSEFMVSQDFESFFQKFDIWTWNEKNVSLKLRGDWMQAKFIPELLDFLNSYDDKKFYLWWFEEPENSSEYKNQKELANKLKNHFLVNKQIFLTTHSEEFLSLYDDNKIEKKFRKANLYHIKKIKNDEWNDFSTINYFNVDENIFEWLDTKTELEKDLWTSLIRAKYSKELKEIENNFFKEIKNIEKEKKILEEEIEKTKKPIIFVEWKWDKIYLEKAWQTLYKKKMPFDIIDKWWKAIISEVENYSWSSLNKKMIAIFDNDHKWYWYFTLNKNDLCKQYDLAWDNLKKHKEKDIWCYILEKPESRKNRVDESRNHRILEMEHLFEDDFIKEKLWKLPPTISPTADEWNVSDNLKKELWKYIQDTTDLLLEKNFENFKKLFKKIIDILN